MARRARITATVLAVAAAALAATTSVSGSVSPVVAALQKTAAAKSSRLTISVSTLVQGRRATTTGTAVQRGRSLHLSMRVGTGLLTVPVEAVGLVEAGHLVMYLRSPVLTPELPAGKTWLKVDLEKQAQVLGVDFTSFVDGSPAQSPQILSSGLVSARRVGAARIAGRDSQRYRVVLDLDRAAAANPGARPSLQKLEQLTHSSRVRDEMWVGGDGRLSRLRTSSAVVVGGLRATSVTTVTYTAYDVPVTIVAPPADRVYEAD